MNLYGLLSAAEEGGAAVSEKLGYGKAALIALFGFIIVFLVLGVLVLLLMLFKLLFSIKIKSKKDNKTEPAIENAATDEEQDEEAVAAITAAITCMFESEHGEEDQAAPFVIKKIHRIK